MKENQKNESSVLSGNSLEAFFTEAPETKTEDVKINEDDFFDKKKEEINSKEELKTPEDLKDTDNPPVTQTEELKNIQTQSSYYYYDNVINDFIEEGEWEDMVVETEVDGETVETPLSELKNVDKETFLNIKQHFKELKNKELEEKYISIEGLDETTKKMVELKQKGGDISSLLQAEIEYVHPLKGYDLEDERIQEAIVRQKLSSSGQLSQATIENEIQTLKKNLELDKRSNEIVEEINTNFDNYVRQEAKRQEKEMEVEKERQKEFRKTLSNTIKNFDIKEEKLVKSLLDASTKYDNNGLSEVDKAFFEAKENPELFTKVAFLLTNEELFDKHMGVKIKNKANLDTVKKVLSLKKRSSTKQTELEKQPEGLDSFFKEQ